MYAVKNVIIVYTLRMMVKLLNKQNKEVSRTNLWDIKYFITRLEFMVGFRNFFKRFFQHSVQSIVYKDF